MVNTNVRPLSLGHVVFLNPQIFVQMVFSHLEMPTFFLRYYAKLLNVLITLKLQNVPRLAKFQSF